LELAVMFLVDSKFQVPTNWRIHCFVL